MKEEFIQTIDTSISGNLAKDLIEMAQDLGISVDELIWTACWQYTRVEENRRGKNPYED